MSKTLEKIPACWIGPESWTFDAAPIQPCPTAFRWDVVLPGKCSEAVVEIACSYRYVLWLNGTLVARGPARALPRHRFLDRLPIAKWLRKGGNHFAAIVLPPTGVTGCSCPTRPGLFCRGKARSGRREVTFGSGPDWKTRTADWIDSHGLLTSLPTGSQEHWDFRKQPKDWPVTACADWPLVRLLGPVGTPPWTFLHPRPVPLLTSESLRPALVWRGSDDRKPFAPEKNPCIAFNQSKVKPVQGVSGGPPFRNAAENLWVFDFRKTRLVLPRLEFLQTGSDTQVEIYYDIAFSERPRAMGGFGTPREGFCDTLRPGGKTGTWTPLQTRGCRFVTVRIAGKKPCRFVPRFESVDYPFSADAVFESEHRPFRQYWKTSAESIRSCSSDIIADTCARENQLWTLDACVSGKAAFYTFGDTRLWRHCLWMIGEGIDGNGIPAAVTPSEPSFMVLFDQTLQWVASCRDYYLRTADQALRREILPAMRRFLEQCRKHLSKENLFAPPAFSWHWVDWAPLDRRPYSLPVNAALLHALDAAQELARWGADEALEKLARQMSGRVHRAIGRFFDHAAGVYRDHLEPIVPLGMQNTFNQTPPDQVVAQSFHGNLQMAALPSLSSARRKIVLRQTARWLRDTDHPRAIMGPGWLQLLLLPFVENGYGKDVAAYLEWACGLQVATGSLTWAEGVHPSEFNTAHGWGAAVNSLFVEGFVGLRPLSPGWTRVRISPRLAGDFLL